MPLYLAEGRLSTLKKNMNNKLFAIAICIGVVAGMLTMAAFLKKPDDSLGGWGVTLSSPSSTTIWVSATSSTVIIPHSTMSIYGSICNHFSTTTAAGQTNSQVYLLVATSSEVSVASSQTSNDHRSYILEVGECVEFEEGKNLTRRTIYGIATTSDTYVTTITQ